MRITPYPPRAHSTASTEGSHQASSEICRPVGVRAREIPELAVPVEDMGPHDGVQIPAAQHVQARLEPFLRNRPAGRDHGHARARGESSNT